MTEGEMLKLSVEEFSRMQGVKSIETIGFTLYLCAGTRKKSHNN